MNIQGIDHVEFYVADARQAAGQLCAAYGFRVDGEGGPHTGLPGQRSVLVRLPGIRILLTAGLSADHPATRYVARHGDGVAVVALATDDASAAFTEAVRRGAEPLAHPVVYEQGITRVTFASVSGFGDVAHRFVQRRGPDEEFAPGVIQRQPSGSAAPGGRPPGIPPQESMPHPRQPFRTNADSDTADGDGGEDILDVIDHIAACVPAGTLDAVVQAYDDIFGFTQIFEERIEVGGQAMDSKVVQSPSGEVTLTLLEPVVSADPGQIDDFLRSHDGAGVQHVAFRTSDIAEAVRILEKRGVQFLATPPAYYDALERRLGAAELPLQELRALNVLADRDPWGLMFQIFTQSVHPRRTFFFELIERRGALTFGTGNIRALYEAVAREHAAAAPPPAPGDRPGATPSDT
ncbi:MAG TPA: VOC family protein [Streptosporangiaceae bacterium]|nr:VOC family protein [Streptosporangiaceae bacterium]